MRAAARWALLMVAQLVASTAAAEPVHLKLAFYESFDTAAYLYGIKPFVDAVNAEAGAEVTIEIFADGALGDRLAEQPRLVLDGTADIAWVIPGQTPYRFPDNALLELPGLFRDLGEATRVYTRLVAQGRLRGYDSFFVIGAYTTGPNLIHSSKPVGSLDALKGQKIRANNQVEAAVLDGLGAIPTVLPVPQIADTIKKGALDGAALAPTALLDYHIAPLTAHHFMLRSGVNPLALVMNRKTFESLPETARAVIRKHSGERAAAAWIDQYGRNETSIFETIRASAGQQFVEPSAQDVRVAEQVFARIIASWTADSGRNAELLKDVRNELTRLRPKR